MKKILSIALIVLLMLFNTVAILFIAMLGEEGAILTIAIPFIFHIPIIKLIRSAFGARPSNVAARICAYMIWIGCAYNASIYLAYQEDGRGLSAFFCVFIAWAIYNMQTKPETRKA